MVSQRHKLSESRRDYVRGRLSKIAAMLAAEAKELQRTREGQENVARAPNSPPERHPDACLVERVRALKEPERRKLFNASKEDAKQGTFLGREIRVGKEGLELEASTKHAQFLIKGFSIQGKLKAAATPGSKEVDNQFGDPDTLLDPESHAAYRKCVGVAQYLAGDRPDIV